MVKPTSYWDRKPPKHKKPDPLQIAGSSLPDCSHACGSCSPCRLVMVSFVCSSLEEAETCPMAYRCMCNNKSYPVPWSYLHFIFFTIYCTISKTYFSSSFSPGSISLQCKLLFFVRNKGVLNFFDSYTWQNLFWK